MGLFENVDKTWYWISCKIWTYKLTRHAPKLGSSNKF